MPETVIEAAEDGNEGQPAQKRKVSAQDKNHLEKRHQTAGEYTKPSAKNNEPGRNQFH